MKLNYTIGGTKDGKVLAYKLDILADCGAYPTLGAILAGLTSLMSSGVYDIPRLEAGGTTVVTNTTQIAAFRGAGRPEAIQVIECAIDRFAAEIGMDPAEVRRKNYVSEFPHTTQSGANYDSGDYTGALDLALRSAGYDELRAEQKRRRDEGATKQLGIGLSSYVEITNPLGEGELGEVEITPDGGAIVRTGSFSHGQGHETSFAMVVAERLGVPFEKVTVHKGDTDEIATGTGTYGSKSLQIGGTASAAAAETVVEQAKQLVADYLEANPEDLVLDKGLGRFHVAGTADPSMSWEELAQRAEGDGRIDELKAANEFKGHPTFPFGTHIAVVEVDTEIGQVELQRMVCVDDAGTLINPMLAEGQVHGGVAIGVAQALYEHYVFGEDGTPLTGNFVSYAFPSAAELPLWETVADGDPDSGEPARCQGDRRVGDDRLDAGRLQRGRRRAGAVRREARGHAGQRRERVARDPGGEGVNISVTVNGTKHDADVEPRTLLVYFLREHLGLKGTNVGCDTTSCGACTVLLDGESVKSCTVLAVQADGTEVTTIEGLAGDGGLHPVQQAFHENHALQCGYCTPGFVMASVSLLKENPNPSEEEIRLGLEGNLCRCTGYHNILKAVQAAARAGA